MNIAVSADMISSEARAAIKAAGGRIEATTDPEVSQVVLPGAQITKSVGRSTYIALPAPSQDALKLIHGSTPDYHCLIRAHPAYASHLEDDAANN